MSRSSALNEKMMGKEFKIRKIKAEDVPQIVAIQESIIQKKVSKKWIQMVKEHLQKQEGIGFVALKDIQVVGFIIGEIKGEGFGLEQSGWIEVVEVHPKQMGIGIGRALADKLFDFFKKKGIHDIYTTVRWDAGDMLSFFKSLGFDRSTFINLRKHLDEKLF
jgi:ribosomal protein S18 acetylase RimI-like enzyme